jgi:hypothetical protein
MNEKKAVRSNTDSLFDFVDFLVNGNQLNFKNKN